MTQKQFIAWNHAELLALRRSGKTLRELAATFRVTSGRIRQVLAVAARMESQPPLADRMLSDPFCDLPVRIRNCLKAEGITERRQVIELLESDGLKPNRFANIGKASIQTIRSAFERY